MKVMANSIPKGGTHLLLRLIELLNLKPHPFWIGADLIRGRGEFFRKWRKGSFSNQVVEIGSEVPVDIGTQWLQKKLKKIPENCVFGAHCQYTPELSALLEAEYIKTICIVRDPRSIAVSHLDYVKRSPGHFFHKHYMSLANDNARLSMSISGGQLGRYKLESLGYRYEQYVDWAKKAGALIVRFEDLVGSKGGGNDEQQRKAIADVISYLSINLTEPEQNAVAEKLFGDTSTFRKGQIDSWKDELNEQQKVDVQRTAGKILIELGYELDDNWVTMA